MKQFHRMQSMVRFLIGLTLLAGCTQDDLITEKTLDTQAFSVSVTDIGYAPMDASGTKATETNLVTAFTVGDQIGLFAVANGQIATTVNNLRLTAQDNGSGGLIWKTSTGENAPNIADGVYYAYYPYRSTLSGSLVPSASTASAFFANVMSSWTVSSDQGTYANYTANDLMISQASLSGGTLSFGMTHCMALSIIKIPANIYTFNNTNPSIPQYIIPLSGSKFNDFVPLFLKQNSYYFLHKPSQASPVYSGSYTNYFGVKKGWEITLNGSAGKYKTYVVNESASVGRAHNLQTGDFLLSDGTILPKTATLSSTDRTNCIGVILKPGFDSSLDDNHYKTKEGATTIPSSTIHAYVVAKRPYDLAKTWAVPSYQTTAIGTSNNTSDFRGYGNSQILKAYAAQLGIGPDLQTIFPAVNYATYGYEFFFDDAPTFTSGWFLPSIGQLEYCYQNRTVIVASMQKIDASFAWKSWYWSSTENGSSAYYYSFSQGNKYSQDKNDTNYLLPMLVF